MGLVRQLSTWLFSHFAKFSWHYVGSGAPEGKETRHNRSIHIKGSSQDEAEAPRVLAEDNGRMFRSAPVDQVRAECELKRPCNARSVRPPRAGKGGDGACNVGSPVEDKRPKNRSSKVAEYAKAVYKEKAQGLQHWASFVFGSGGWI